VSAGEHNHGFGVTAECAQFLDSIVYLIDNELADEDVVAVRLHIDGCTPCHERYEVQRTVKAVVARSCAERAPEDLRARVLMSIREVRIELEG
jgi:mycothiol system anti-sigma-R factor